MARRVAISVAAVALFLALAGATYQGVATALERRRFPRPGWLVPVGDHQLHITCEGSGTATVVLEAPAAGMSSAWAHVQAAVSRATRVCSYDRAGLGWSQAGDEPYSPERVAREFRTLLEGSGERPPYVLVGHELGAAFAVLEAAQLGDLAAALVLVDAPAPGADSPPASVVRLVNASPWLARAGILRATGTLSRAAEGLPEPAAGTLRMFLNRPDHLTRAARELRRWDEAVRLAAESGLRPDIPSISLSVTSGDRLRFLTDEDDAARVSAAILSAVDQLPHAAAMD